METRRALKLRVITPTLLVRDLEASLRFYVDELGFTVESTWPEDDPTFCILDHGPTHLMLGTEPFDSVEAPVMTGQLHIDVEGGVAELHERLAGRFPILWGPEVYAYGRREFSVRDPDGYRLVFSELTDDPATCDVD